jgi:pimeloyl-ACP methyl ester carboxylesterase
LAKVLFLHGLDAQPGGVKPTFLAARGHDVSNPALPREDFDASVRIAKNALQTQRPDVVVGSSRGGAVAMAMKPDGLPLILLAPAWRFFLDQPTLVGPVHIIHSPADSLIPIDHSKELRRLFPDQVILYESGDRHTLTDPASLEQLDASVRQLASGSHH